MIYYTSRLKKALQEKKKIYVWFIMITYTEIFHIYKLHINDFKWLEVSESKQDSVVASWIQKPFFVPHFLLVGKGLSACCTFP